jgi:hypothetical protein
MQHSAHTQVYLHSNKRSYEEIHSKSKKFPDLGSPRITSAEESAVDEINRSNIISATALQN